MTIRRTQVQIDCVGKLRRAFEHGHRAALLQLPTGQGKSLVAVDVFKKWGRPRGLNFLLVTPADKPLSEGWRAALALDEDANAVHRAGMPFHLDRSTGRPANACRVTIRQLTKFFERGARANEDWQRWLVQHEAFVVVDEFHRNRKWRQALSLAFERESDRHLAAWFRPGRGRRPRAPVWLLLSATPYNPVELDFQLDQSAATADADADVEREVRALGSEVRRTLYALAALDDHRGGSAREAVTELVRKVEDALAAPEASDRVSIGSGPLTIVPGTTHDLRPSRRAPALVVKIPEHTERDLLVVQEVYRRLLSGRDRQSGVVALAERLVLAGVRPTNGCRRLEQHGYGRATVAAVAKARLPSGVRLAALESLVSVARAAVSDGDKVLVFCSHRAAAVAALRALRSGMKALPRRDVAVASSGIRDVDSAAAFNSSESPRVLVTTDVNSESVDLHARCRTMIHFELPWTPLRVMQRYGRLWRLMQGGRQRIPRVFHVVHPGSVGEEILNRLRRRWDYLRVLGIDYVDLGVALGTRVPAVPW